MGILRRMGLGLLLVFIVFYALTASYYLPRTELVTLTGTEVKRADVEQKDGSTATSDVRYVMTTRQSDGTAMVFRNQDTGWGWPPYFKFDSGDIAGEVMSLAKTRPDATILATYYGWRTNLFSWYPNLIDVEEVEPNYQALPIFNIVFLIGSAIFFIMFFLWLRKLSKWRPGAKKKAAAAAAAAAESEAVEPAEPTDESATP